MDQKRRFEIRAEVLHEDLESLSREPIGIVDSIDAEVTVHIDGRPLFVTPEGQARSAQVPILVFLLYLAQALDRLRKEETSEERVHLTATLYEFHLRKRGAEIEFEIYELGHRGKDSKLVASTLLPFGELVGEFNAVAKATLAKVLAVNPRLRQNEEVAALLDLSAALAAWTTTGTPRT